MLFLGPLVLAISLLPNYGFSGVVVGLLIVTALSLLGFVVRERRAANPLFDLKVLRTRTFTIALIGGTITWGGLLGALFIGQQYTAGCPRLQSARRGVDHPAGRDLPVPRGPPIGEPDRQARIAGPAGARAPDHRDRLPQHGGLVQRRSVGRRRRDHLCVPGTRYRSRRPALIELVDGFGAGRTSRDGFRVERSAARFRGGVLPSGHGHAARRPIHQLFHQGVRESPPDQADQLSKQAVASISQSFTGAAQVAKQFPQAQAQDIINAAKQAFIDGKTAALIFATLAAGVGFLVVFFFYPRREAEDATYARVAGRSPRDGDTA